ncbi:hypothetical protein [Nocardioides speluncae]|uniref:hypothetical protein n=1 Tax=Nocardioides speluncae TaxID=2670337 RepID=UPI000D699783|nr:hypothetical protein [Nocardioides speluncae]
MARRKAFVHIGLNGTGTAFLDGALATHAESLRESGLALAAGSAEEMFLAAVEITRDHRAWDLHRADVEGAWARICRRGVKARSDFLVTQDLLAGATKDQAALLLDGLAGLEAHLIVTVRDPASTLLGEWEEATKAGQSVSFRRFQERVMDPARAHDDAASFWLAQELSEVLDRWAARLNPQRVHIVVVPRDGDIRGAIWTALGIITGFDAEALALPGVDAAPAGLGRRELSVLRSVNKSIDGRISGQLRRTVLKRFFAERVLTSGPDRSTTRGLTRAGLVPPDLYDDLLVLSERWNKKILDAGYDVHGNLDNLLPAVPDKRALLPDDVPAKDQLQTTTDALADVLVEVARLREHNERLEVRNAKLEKKRKKLKRKLKLAATDPGP